MITIKDLLSVPDDETRTYKSIEIAQFCIEIAGVLSNLEESEDQIFMNKRQWRNRINPPSEGRLVGRAFGRDFYAQSEAGKL